MRRILIAAVGPLALLIGLLSLARAPTTTAGGGWELLAFGGIPVQQVAVDRQDANTLHAILGTDTQMVSSDGGQTWRTVPGDLRPFYAQDPNRPQTYFRWNPESSPTGGIQRSTDNGQTWSLVWRSPTRYASSYGIMAAPPAGAGVPSVVLASTFIDVGVPRAENRRLLRSLDGGESWTDVQFPVGFSLKFEALAFDTTRQVSFAAASGKISSFGAYTETSPPVLWASRDYFQSDFTRVSLPPRVFEIKAMTFGQGQLLLVGREQPLERLIFNLWQSPDDGSSWFPLTLSGAWCSFVSLWPGNPTRILLGAISGSRCDGGLWVRDLPAIQHAYLPLVNAGFVGGW